MQEALYPGLRPRDSTGRVGLGRGPPPQVNSGHWLWAGRRPEPGRDERVCQGGGGWGAGFLRAPPVLAQASCCWAPAPGISDARSCSQRPRVSSPGQPCAPWRGAWGAAPQGRPFLPTPHPRSPAHCRRLPVVLQLLARPTDSGQGAAGFMVACSCEDRGVCARLCGDATWPGTVPQVSALVAPAEMAPECGPPAPGPSVWTPAPPEEGRQLREWGRLGWGLGPEGLRAALRTGGHAQDLPRLPVTWCSGSEPWLSPGAWERN